MNLVQILRLLSNLDDLLQSKCCASSCQMNEQQQQHKQRKNGSNRTNKMWKKRLYERQESRSPVLIALNRNKSLMEYDKRIRHWYSHINASWTEYTYAYIDLSIFVHPKTPPEEHANWLMEVVQVRLWNEIFYCYAIQHANKLKNEIKHINAIVLFYSIRHHSPNLSSLILTCSCACILTYTLSLNSLVVPYFCVTLEWIYSKQAFIRRIVLTSTAIFYGPKRIITNRMAKKKSQAHRNTEQDSEKKNETKRIKWNRIQRNKRTIFALKCRG